MAEVSKIRAEKEFAPLSTSFTNVLAALPKPDDNIDPCTALEEQAKTLKREIQRQSDTLNTKLNHFIGAVGSAEITNVLLSTIDYFFVNRPTSEQENAAIKNCLKIGFKEEDLKALKAETSKCLDAGVEMPSHDLLGLWEKIESNIGFYFKIGVAGFAGIIVGAAIRRTINKLKLLRIDDQLLDLKDSGKCKEPNKSPDKVPVLVKKPARKKSDADNKKRVVEEVIRPPLISPGLQPVLPRAINDAAIPYMSPSLRMVLPQQQVFSPQTLMPNMRQMEGRSVPSIRPTTQAEINAARQATETRTQQMQNDANALFFMMFVMPVVVVPLAGAGGATTGAVAAGEKTFAAGRVLQLSFRGFAAYMAATNTAQAATPKPISKSSGFTIDKEQLAEAYSKAVVDAYENYSGSRNPLVVYEYVSPQDVAKYGSTEKALAVVSKRHAGMRAADIRAERLEAIRVDAKGKLNRFIDEALPILNENYITLQKEMHASFIADPANTNPKSDEYRAELLQNYTKAVGDFKTALQAKTYEHTPQVKEYDTTAYITFTP